MLATISAIRPRALTAYSAIYRGLQRRLRPLLPLAAFCGLLPISCASDHLQCQKDIEILKNRLFEVEMETAMAMANARCGNEVSDLMRDVSALCVKDRWCTNSEILSAISDADSQGRFLLLMKTQRSAAFYFPNPWQNPVHLLRLGKIIGKRQLPRTKVLVVANTTARKPTKSGGSDAVAVEAARERVEEVVRQLKETSEKSHAADPRIPVIRDEDILVWLVPYLVQDTDLVHLTADGKPPVGYYNMTAGKQSLLQQRQAVLTSVWAYLIDCWPDPPPNPGAGPISPTNLLTNTLSSSNP
jgi:hypothetical protein